MELSPLNGRSRSTVQVYRLVRSQIVIYKIARLRDLKASKGTTTVYSISYQLSSKTIRWKQVRVHESNHCRPGYQKKGGQAFSYQKKEEMLCKELR